MTNGQEAVEHGEDKNEGGGGAEGDDPGEGVRREGGVGEGGQAEDEGGEAAREEAAAGGDEPVDAVGEVEVEGGAVRAGQT